MTTADEALEPGDHVRIRKARWTVIRRAAYRDVSVVEVAGADTSNAGERARFILPFEPVARDGMGGACRVERRSVWRRVATRTLASAIPAPYSLRSIAGADITLLPYQLEPALAVTRGDTVRLLIADAVGLGKTIQAGVIAAEVLVRRADPHVLVVTPAGLRHQWQEELAARLHLPSVILDSTAVAYHSRFDGMNPWTTHPLAITSIDLVKRPEVMRSLEGVVWDVVIFDEAHGLVGPSDRSTAARVLGERARVLVLLTATPHSGDDGAFERLCAIGNLDRAFPLMVFRRTRADAGVHLRRHTKWLRVRPAPDERVMHDLLLAYAVRVWSEAGPAGRGARLAATVLMRRGCSSAAALARSLDRRLALLAAPASTGDVQMLLPFLDPATTDEEPEGLLGTPGFRDADAERHALEQLRRVAVRAAQEESKVRAIRRLLSRTTEAVIVFTEYRDTLASLSAALFDHAHVLLHGGHTARERADSLHEFTTANVRLLLATDAAAEGLNLHARCRFVLNLELPWSATRLEQRIGRVERLGQASPVHALNLLAAGTREEMTLAVLHRRLERMRAALGGLGVTEPSEHEIAGAMVEGEAAKARAHMPDWRAQTGLCTSALGDIAALESLRARGARALWRRTGSEGPEPNSPPLAALRRGTPGCYWAFWLSFSAEDGELLWRQLISTQGFTDMVVDGNAGRMRALLDTRTAAIRAVIQVVHVANLQTFHILTTPALELAQRRELAIARAVTDRHARLSAAVLQRGLFDRRTDRAAAAQSALLEETLARCRGELERIVHRQKPRCGPVHLAFAAVVK